MIAVDRIYSILSERLNMPEVRAVVAWTQENTYNREELWRFAQSEDRRVSVNALWVMTHLPESEKSWLQSHQDDLARMLIREIDTSKRRLILQLLKAQDFNPENLRADLLDFCLSKINAECEPYAVRCFSLYVAFRMCRHYPELIAELEQYLDVLSSQQLSPGLRSALRQTKANISRLKKRQQ